MIKIILISGSEIRGGSCCDWLERLSASSQGGCLIFDGFWVCLAAQLKLPSYVRNHGHLPGLGSVLKVILLEKLMILSCFWIVLVGRQIFGLSYQINHPLILKFFFFITFASWNLELELELELELVYLYELTLEHLFFQMMLFLLQ